MRINVYGLGYVGCVAASCWAKDGHLVQGIDIDPLKVDIINKGRSPIVEPGLDALIRDATGSGRLAATTSDIEQAEVSIICVGTPSGDNGELDLSAIMNVVQQIGTYLEKQDGYHVVCIRSTILPGTIENIVIPELEKASGRCAGSGFGVCMNPEFLREGTSINDFYNPPITIIGQLDSRSGDCVEKLYSGVEAPVFRTALKTAEMLKYASNAFHAVKITFANEIGSVCRLLGVDGQQVMKLVTEDRKLNISSAYLKPGFAFGGSCLPKDLRALLQRARELHQELPMLSSVLISNEEQINAAYRMIRRAKKKAIGILGLSFKQGTDDLRESPIVELAERLLGKGYDVSIYDEEVLIARIFGSNKRYIEGVIPHISSLLRESADDVVSRSEVIVIAREIPEIASLSSRLSNGKIVIDLIGLKARPANCQYLAISW